MNQENLYDILLGPVVTEKSTMGSEFDVKVMNVNTNRTKGKVKRFRGHIGKRSDYKKAVVTLAEGQAIDVTAGI